MSFLSRFNFDPSKMDGIIWAIMVFVWLVVLGCGIGSVFSRGPGFSKRQRIFWISMMVFIPVFGILAYLPYSMKREGFTLMRQTRTDKGKNAWKH